MNRSAEMVCLESELHRVNVCLKGYNIAANITFQGWTFIHKEPWKVRGMMFFLPGTIHLEARVCLKLDTLFENAHVPREFKA